MNFQELIRSFFLHIYTTLLKNVHVQVDTKIDSRCSVVSLLFAAPIPTPVIFMIFLPLVYIVLTLTRTVFS